MPYSKQAGVYAIQNNLDGKKYIGSSVLLSRRKSGHFSSLNRGDHPNKKLQRAWIKYGGKENFSFKILLICKKEDIVFYEQRALDIYDSVNNGYNIRPVAESNAGIVWSKEVIEKRAAGMRGRKLSPEHYAKLKARKVSDETRKKMSIAALNMTDEHRKNLSIANKGRKYSDDQKKAMSLRMKGRPLPKGTIEKVMATKIKNNTVAAAALNPNRLASMQTEEYKKKMSESIKAMWAKRKAEKKEN